MAGGDGAGPWSSLGEGLGEGTMEPLPFSGQEVFVGSLLEQRVTERVVALAGVARRPGHQHLAADGLPQRVEQLITLHRRHARKEVVVDASARHGHDADDGLRRFRESHDPSEQHLAERRRQTTIGGVLTGPEQLLDEERVAVRAAMDLGGEVVVRRCPEDRRQERRRLARVEAMKVEAFDPPASLELGQPRQERMPPMELVRPERHDQHDPIGAQVPDEEGDGLARRRDRPNADPR